MKKIFFLVFLGVVRSLSGAVQIGDAAPELPADAWYSGKAFSLKESRGKPVVLFFWKVEKGDVRHIPAMVKQAQYAAPGCRVALVANGMLSILRNMPMNQYIRIPLLADEKGKLMEQYLPGDMGTPAAVLIDGKGQIVWRGMFTRIKGMLARLQSGKLDLNTVRHQEQFASELSALQKKKEHEKALALIEKELKNKPANPVELAALQAGILLKQLNSPEKALKSVREAQNLFPKEPALWEMELKLLEQCSGAEKTPEFYARVIRRFPDQVSLLLKFLQYEMSLNCTQMRPGNAYMLARAAWHAPKFKDKTEQGKAALFYAQTLYCCGRPDLALKMAEKALPLLKGSQQEKGAAGIAEFYRKVQKLAPGIRE